MRKGVIITLVILLILGVSGWYFYDKNIRYGKPIRDEMGSPFDDYFEKILKKRSMTFWNFNGNFQVVVFSFPSSDITERQLQNKERAYADPRNGEKIKKTISGFPAVIIKFTENSNLFMVRIDDKLLHVSTDRSLEDAESFIEWFIRYWI